MVLVVVGSLRPRHLSIIFLFFFVVVVSVVFVAVSAPVKVAKTINVTAFPETNVTKHQLI